jgi:hypothetical protein
MTRKIDTTHIYESSSDMTECLRPIEAGGAFNIADSIDDTAEELNMLMAHLHEAKQLIAEMVDKMQAETHEPCPTEHKCVAFLEEFTAINDSRGERW